MSGDAQKPARSEVSAALSSCRSAFIGIGLFSGLINVLMLTGSIFMMQVYDRVLPSRSVPTLVGLAILVLGLYAFQGVLDGIRGRIFVRIGASLDEKLGRRAFDAVVRLPLRTRGGGDGQQPLRDLDQVRGFLASGGPAALFDLPWMPLYIAVCYMFHPALGLVAFAGAVILLVVTLLSEVLTRAPNMAATSAAMQRSAVAEASRRNAEVLAAMGMAGRLGAVWGEANRKYLSAHERASDVAGGLGALSRVLRMVLQSGVLALGAYLVIHQQATAGIIIASAILVARAVAPVELAVANWKNFLGARQSWRRLSELFAFLPPQEEPMALPPPAAQISVENIGIIPPGDRRLVVQDIVFAVAKGSALGIIGPSASGKSSLARVLVGVWKPARGTVRLDGGALEQWAPEALGRHIGYLPQDVELFAGTVAQNISRFDPDADSPAIIAAARGAGVHDLVLRLPDGYETQIGEGGAALSAGQRQRIALARALYRDPFLVVLDEPNSNLDAEGEQALTQAILGVRARGGIVVVIAHRPSALAGVDLVLMLAEGRQQAFGPKDEVLKKVLRPATPIARPLQVVGDRQAHEHAS